MKPQFKLFMMVLLFVVGCGPSVQEDNISIEVPTDAPQMNMAVSAYPDSYPGTDSGYPIANADTIVNLPNEMLPVPAPTNSETGTVTGVLLMGEDDALPMKGAILYLGKIVNIENNIPALAALNKQVAPTAQASEVGQFIFTDVPIGRYTLIYDLITATFVLNQPTGGDFIIEVTGADVVDLGELRYDELPTLNPQ